MSFPYTTKKEQYVIETLNGRGDWHVFRHGFSSLKDAKKLADERAVGYEGVRILKVTKTTVEEDVTPPRGTSEGIGYPQRDGDGNGKPENL